jgi:hypothetical protein
VSNPNASSIFVTVAFAAQLKWKCTLSLKIAPPLHPPTCLRPCAAPQSPFFEHLPLTQQPPFSTQTRLRFLNIDHPPRGFAPSGRLIRPDEVATLAVYWIGDESRPVSGTVMEFEQFPVIGRNPPKEHL